MHTAESILKTTFGYDTFKPLQREIIANVQARRDTLVIMPTGGGKSLTYQVPALLFEGLTVVVSPLIALMKDQVEQLSALGVPALFLNSSLAPEEYQQNMDLVKRGRIKLLYVAPETLLTARLSSLLSGLQVDLFAIDEAHCISEWGHDFRPEYRQLVGVRRRFPSAVCMALTATATPRVRHDIASTLGFSQSNEFMASFNRENLFIQVTPKRDPVAQTLRFLENFKDQSGIIRSEYRQLVGVRRRFPSAVCMALTATATPRVRHDIASTLGFSQSNEFMASFNRENLFIQVTPKRDPVAQTLRFLENFKDQSGII